MGDFWGGFPDGEWVEVGGRRYVISVQGKETQRMLEESYGLCDSEMARILLRSGLVDEVKKIVILHELVHAADIAISGAGALTEQQVNGISELLLGAMRSNVDLVEWMLE